MNSPRESYGGIVDPLFRNPEFSVGIETEPSSSQRKGRSCLAFSEAEDAAFTFLEQDMRKQLCALRLSEGNDYVVDTDAVGNLYITYFGEDPNTTVLYHSHIDSVPDGGPLDGVWGVDIARDLLLKLAQYRAESGVKTKNSLTLVAWRAEESSVTGRACVGSAIATGELTPEKLCQMQYGRNGDEETLRGHWSRYEQQGRPWEEVLQAAENPIIRDDGTGTGTLEIALPSGTRKIAMAEEAHIAQANLLQTTGNDVHLAQGGIGGSIREDLVISPEMLETHTHQIRQGEYAIVEIEILGQEAHTGGTVHNRDEKKTQGGPWFRNDALVGTHILFKELFGKGHENPGVRVLSVQPDNLTGYTKVPGKQRIRLLIRSSDANEFGHTALESCRTILRDTKGLNMTWDVKQALPGELVSICTKQAVRLLSIPARMEGAARKTDTQARGNPRVIYQVTSTGADFVLTPEHGFSMKLDFRFTDVSHIQRLRDHVAQEIQVKVLNRSFPGCTVDEICSERSRTASGTVSDIITEQKEGIAACLGYSVIRAPVLPGHDTNTLAKAKEGASGQGTQISMTIARDNALSHNPEEAATAESLRKAQLISQIAVVKCLGLLGDTEDHFIVRLLQQRECIPVITL